MPGFKDWSGAYNNSFSSGVLQSATEAGMLSLSAKSPIAVGLSAAYFFGPKVGVKIRLDYLSKQGFQNGDSTYSLTWRWGGSPEYNRSKDWSLGGDLTAMPVSLNGVFRFMDGPKLSVWGEAGLSVVMAKLKETSTAGYGSTWGSGTQYIDYFDIPIKADASKTAFGFNAGLGAEYKMGPKLGAFLEAGLIMAGSIAADWKSQPGKYASNLNAGWTLTYEGASTGNFDSILPTLDAKLTFFRLAAGVHIRI
jgi:opacity protein-like surface antigen